jgi:DNA-binding phage protein
MDVASERINQLRQLLSQAASTRRLVSAHAKRLCTVSDTQMLRKHVNAMLSSLKQQLEQGAEVASQASQALLDDSSGPESVKARSMTNVQQMERQLMAIADEYPALLRSIAAKQQQEPPRPTPRRSTLSSEETRLHGTREKGTGMPGQQQAQVQEQAEAQMSRLEVQQIGQDIHERDQDIQELVGSALEVRQVAADIAQLIDHQSSAVDRVAVNMENVAQNVDMGTEQITRAHARQRKFRIDCLGWVLIVLGVILGVYVGLLMQ